MMRNRTWRRPIVYLVCLFILVSIDSYFLIAAFHRVTSQQESVRRSYRSIDQLAVVTSRLRDAEIQARRFVDTDDDDINQLLTHYDDVEREAVVASSLVARDSTSVALLKRFNEVLKNREDRLKIVKAEHLKLGFGEVARALREGDAQYSQLAALLSKIKDVQEQTLQGSLSPTSQYATMFYAAAFGTALLNLFVGAVAYGQNELLRRKQETETTLFDERSRDMNESSAASALVSGEIAPEEFARSVRRFFKEQFDAVAVNVYAYRDGKIENIGSETPATEQGEQNTSLIKESIKRVGPTIIRDVPENFWRAGTALMNALPRSLMLIPLRFQGVEIGLIEAALLAEPVTGLSDRLTNLAQIFAVSLHASESKRQTDQLLKQTIKQAAELEVQQEELRTNNEELESQARALEIQQHTLTLRNVDFEVSQVQLEKRAADLTRANQYKSDFLAKMSHELRTPLNGLLILSDLLTENKERTLTQQQQKFAKSINSAGHDLLNLINDILDLSKVEARKLTLHVTEFTLEELFASKRRTFEPQTDAKGLKLNTELSEDLKSLHIRTDRQRLDQILRNFLSNAVKFTERGTVQLSAELNPMSQIVTFSVRDSGIGIPAENQKLIFDAFEQADSAVSSKYGGTGLGLTIAKELAALLGGEIFLASQLGSGSEFKVSIPVNFVASDQPSASEQTDHDVIREVTGETRSLPVGTDLESTSLHAARARVSQLDPNKKSVLIVEDDEAFRSAVAESVKRFGYEPVEIGDGAMAIELLQTFLPDAILLDIKIPGLSGLGVLEILKKTPALRHIPVHMISGLEYQTNALRLGAFGYLTKPVTTEKIGSALERIEGMLSRRLKRLLLIEDNEVQKEALKALFADSSLEVETAGTGRTALDKIYTGSFDCIVLDLTLPDVSGFDLLSELRKLDVSLPPIVIYTGRDLSDEEQDYLRKYSESIVIKGARSPRRLLDEVNLFLHRVDSSLSDAEREMLASYRVDDGALTGRTVLIVDDDVRNIFALTSAFEAKGLKVYFAKDGAQALKVIEDKSDIELVLMDIMMPVMDGLEAIRRIRSHNDKRIKNLPVVALTAKAMREDHEQCMEAGANDYLPKPIILENLITVMKVWLSRPGNKILA